METPFIQNMISFEKDKRVPLIAVATALLYTSYKLIQVVANSKKNTILYRDTGA
jgi:hypothetical protein